MKKPTPRRQPVNDWDEDQFRYTPEALQSKEDVENKVNVLAARSLQEIEKILNSPKSTNSHKLAAAKLLVPFVKAMPEKKTRQTVANEVGDLSPDEIFELLKEAVQNIPSDKKDILIALMARDDDQEELLH
jgi:hypothetical protein